VCFFSSIYIMFIIGERLVKKLCNEGSKNHVVEILKESLFVFSPCFDLQPFRSCLITLLRVELYCNNKTNQMHGNNE
jgi:hypothetical protein